MSARQIVSALAVTSAIPDVRSGLVRVARGTPKALFTVQVSLQAAASGTNALHVTAEHVPNPGDGETAWIHVEIKDPDTFESMVVDEVGAGSVFTRSVELPSCGGTYRFRFRRSGTGSNVFVVTAFAAP